MSADDLGIFTTDEELDRLWAIRDPTLAVEWPKGVGLHVKYEAATAYDERFGENPPAYG